MERPGRISVAGAAVKLRATRRRGAGFTVGLAGRVLRSAATWILRSAVQPSIRTVGVRRKAFLPANFVHRLRARAVVLESCIEGAKANIVDLDH